MIRPTFAEVHLHAIRENIRRIREQLQPGVKIMAVVKADAYGHGLVPVAREAIQIGADWLGVAIPEEGQMLRSAGILQPILVLGAIPSHLAQEVVELDLRQTVFDMETIQELEKQGAKYKKEVYVHLKIDTGMNRIGIHEKQELAEVLALLQECTYVKLEGMFTHFAVSDTRDKTFTIEQNCRFHEAIEMVKQKGFELSIIHAANSAAILDCPFAHYDMVRAGIGMYGYYPSDEVSRSVSLQPALDWKTHIIHIKEIQAGESVSYGRIFSAEQKRKIATLPVGYADGYRRVLGNRGFVLVRGKRAAVVGRVCMDQCMIDISEIPDANIGDEVVLLGEQEEDKISADEMAQWCDTISYEVLTSISKRVPRIYKE